MHKSFIVAFGTIALAGCGEAPSPKEEAAVPAKPVAGTYEVTATVKSLVSTDKSPLPTFTKVGEVTKTVGCIGTDGAPAPELLAAKGDVCQVKDPYTRNGRMNVTLDCRRKGQGQVLAMLDGAYTADGFTGTVTANSVFTGSGDYKMVQDIVAKKTSDQCTAAAAPKA